MLSPKSSSHITLLPQDREIMAITGLTEKQYRFFIRQAILNSKLRPGEPVAFELVTFAVTLVVGVALSAISALLTPKPQLRKAASVDTLNVQGQTIVRGDEFAPKSGFDSVQNVVELGSTVPLVYSNRQVIDGKSYGGVRVNTNLLWSQIYSVGGGQLLRAIFLAGEGDPSAMELDPTQFAIGNNLINGYELASQEAGRISIYYNKNGQRLLSSSYLTGVRADLDVGNAQNDGADDVFQVRSDDNDWKPDFCFASKPSTQTSFGVHGFIANNLGFRVNPVFRPGTQFTVRSDNEVSCKGDRQEIASRNKQNITFAGKSGLLASNRGLQNLSEGQNVSYVLYPESALNDGLYDNGEIVFGVGSVSVGDVAQAVASRQKQYDELINVGALYKIGSALAICTERTANPFVSDADNEPVGGGTFVSATFKIVRSGRSDFYSFSDIKRNSFPVATSHSHIFRCAIANFVTEKRGRVVEVGLRSTLQTTISGICNFRDARSYYVIDRDACEKFDGDDADGTTPINFVSGTYTGPEQRYSFFRLSYRVAGDNVEYTDLDVCFGVRSATGAAVYNYLRLEFPLERRYEIRIEPLSGWEIRSGETTGNLAILDYAVNAVQTIQSGAVKVQFSGEIINRTQGNFALPFLRPKAVKINLGTFSSYNIGTGILTLSSAVDTTALSDDYDYTLTPGDKVYVQYSGGDDLYVTMANPAFDALNPSEIKTLTSLSQEDTTLTNVDTTTLVGNTVYLLLSRDLGNGFDDGQYYGDAWAKLAESFVYNEMTTTASQPEHEVVYVNNVSPNQQTPNYDGLAIVGMNIRSSQELSRLDQFSVYVNKGITGSSAFPDVLYDLLTNRRYGTGSTMSSQQIDVASFNEAKQWTYNRRYFFDGAIIEKINIRSWGAARAQDFLLDLVVRNGKFALQPIVNLYGPENITALFTAGNIIDGSFELSYIDAADRIPPRISVRWREEREASDISSNGLFPSVREVIVREADVDNLAPLEQIDLSDFCTSERHAIDRAKIECRFRRYVTHTIRFKTVPSQAALDIGSVFKLGMESVSYEQPQNGAVAADGTVTAWPPLSDGTYQVLLWDGASSAIEETTLSVVGGKSDRTNSVFCLRNAQSNTQTYKTQSLSFDEDGNIEVEAVHLPTNNLGISLISEGFDDDSNWSLDGALGL